MCDPLTVRTRASKLGAPKIAATSGRITSPTRDSTTAAKAAPIASPTARSIRLPEKAKLRKLDNRLRMRLSPTADELCGVSPRPCTLIGFHCPVCGSLRPAEAGRPYPRAVRRLEGQDRQAA